MHPEGALYFHKNSELKIVTGENLSSAVVSEHVQHWSDQVVGMFGKVGFPLSESYELFLESREDDLSYGYYIVDHLKRCIFWLEPVLTEDVGMNPAFSLEHLREYHTSTLNRGSSNGVFLVSGHELEEMYWLHVEYYPSHAGVLTDGVVDDLLNTFAHAQGGTCVRNNLAGDRRFLKRISDALTSNVSTFPYSAEESARFMKLIKPYRGKSLDGRLICVVARLNSFIGAFAALLRKR